MLMSTPIPPEVQNQLRAVSARGERSWGSVIVRTYRLTQPETAINEQSDDSHHEGSRLFARRYEMDHSYRDQRRGNPSPEPIELDQSPVWFSHPVSTRFLGHRLAQVLRSVIRQN
jgi:hypothetical protein